MYVRSFYYFLLLSAVCTSIVCGGPRRGRRQAVSGSPTTSKPKVDAAPADSVVALIEDGPHPAGETKHSQETNETPVYDATAESLKKKMDEEIEDYHEIKKRIQFLEDHLKEHSDFNLIKTEDLVNAQQSLEDIKSKIIKPLEVNLLSVRGQVSNLHHSVTEEEKSFINSVIENADNFLASSNAKIKNLEFMEQDWESQEESEKIRQISEGAGSRNKDGPTPLGSPLLRAMSQSLGKTEGGLRSNRLRKVKKVLHAQRIKKPKMEVTIADENDIHVKEVEIDVHRVKQQLDYERKMDEEPGYAHKVKLAFDEAAQKSRKYLDEHFGKIRPDDHESEDTPPSWVLVVVLGVLSALLMVAVVMLLCYKTRPSQAWRMGMARGDHLTRGYCELNDVSQQQTGLQNNWSESGWSSWDARNAQKLK